MKHESDPREPRLRPVVWCRAVLTPRCSLLLIAFTLVVVSGLFACRWSS